MTFPAGLGALYFNNRLLIISKKPHINYVKLFQYQMTMWIKSLYMCNCVLCLACKCSVSTNCDLFYILEKSLLLTGSSFGRNYKRSNTGIPMFYDIWSLGVKLGISGSSFDVTYFSFVVTWYLLEDILSLIIVFWTTSLWMGCLWSAWHCFHIFQEKAQPSVAFTKMERIFLCKLHFY